MCVQGPKRYAQNSSTVADQAHGGLAATSHRKNILKNPISHENA